MLLNVKRLKISWYGIGALGIIVFAALLRIVLTVLGWPPTNSDEATMGLMAIHISTLKDFPIFMYGQLYMSSIEAYIAAGLFHIFGISLFSLRLANIFLFTVTLISMYLLAGLLYTKGLALVTIGLLSVGSVMMVFTELMAHGGYPEVFTLGTVAFLLASYLALTSRQYHSRRRQIGRMLAFGGWGLTVALGFWGDYIMLSMILTTGLLLLLFCWRDMLRGAIVPLLLGLLIGAIPLLIYNYTAMPGHSTWSVMWGLHSDFSLEQARNPVYAGYPLLSQIRGALLVSLPMATGSPSLCFDANWVQIGRGGSFTSYSCLLIHGNWGLASLGISWSVGFLLLWVISVSHELRMLWKIIKVKGQAESPARRRAIIRHSARLILLGNAALTLLEFVMSPVAGVFPAAARYLLALLISTPALIAPLWGLAHDNEEMQEITLEAPPTQASSAGSVWRSIGARFATTRFVLRVAGALFLVAVILFGTISIFFELPTSRSVDQERQALIHDLQSIGATHFYTDYWTCNDLIFLSKEQLICGVLNGMQEGLNRQPSYYTIVKSDPRSAYVFPIGSSEIAVLAHQAALNPGKYRRFAFDGYVIYQPVG